MNGGPMLTAAQCAQRFGVHVRTWQRWAREGLVPAGVRIGARTWRWPESALEDVLRTRTAAEETAP